jgi:hypothetical protein
MTQGWPARLLAGPGGVLLMGVIWGILASPKASAPSTARPTWSSGLRGLEWSGGTCLLGGRPTLRGLGAPVVYLVNALMLGSP